MPYTTQADIDAFVTDVLTAVDDICTERTGRTLADYCEAEPTGWKWRMLRIIASQFGFTVEDVAENVAWSVITVPCDIVRTPVPV